MMLEVEAKRRYVNRRFELKFKLPMANFPGFNITRFNSHLVM